MQEYYRIGEFSKLTGVSIKSLRYYDELNILKPAYVDKDTNYRYYIPEQMIALNIIKLCVSLNIPLNNLSKNELYPNFKDIIIEGKAKAQDVLVQTKKMLLLIEDLLNQIDRLDTERIENEVYKATINKRKILITEWSMNNKSNDYLKDIAILNKKASDLDLTVLSQQGLVYVKEENKYYVYIAFDGEYEGEDYIEFKDSEYDCIILKEKKLPDVPSIVKDKIGEPNYVFYLNTDIYDFCLHHSLHMLEIQCLKNGNM